MASSMDSFFARLRGQKAKPMQTVGFAGTALYAGMVQDNEESPELKGTKKYETFSEVLANVSIAAAGVRYFLNLTSKAKWSFTPSEADVDGKYAELAESILTDDPRTPWHRIVRRAAMHRFYGFSIQEWTARRRQDGVITFLDIAPRAQKTIERWDVAEDGEVLGVVQRSPQTLQEIYMPRSKLLYVVDDTLSDSPEGLGLFRHLVKPANRLWRYEQREGFGFETDLRGMPVGDGPFTKLAQMVKAGEITEAQRIAIEKPMRDFIKNHIKNPRLGMLLDSQPYESEDEASTPSSTPQWKLDLLTANGSSLEALAAAIVRMSKEIARILGVEQLLLGEGSAGSFALSKDKTQSLFLTVDGTLDELVDVVNADLLWTVWQLNGWDPIYMPDIGKEAVRYQDVEQITASLANMAQAGAVLAPDDPAINDVRDLLGISPADLENLGFGDTSLSGDGSGAGDTEGMVEDPENDLPEENV